MSKTRKVEPIEAFDTVFGVVTIGADESVKYPMSKAVRFAPHMRSRR